MPSTINTLLDDALGPLGYYGAFGVNIHTDFPAPNSYDEAIVASAQARGVPIISYKQLLQWTDGRNASTIRSLDWRAGTLTFTTTVGPGATGLQAMLPVNGPSGRCRRSPRTPRRLPTRSRRSRASATRCSTPPTPPSRRRTASAARPRPATSLRPFLLPPTTPDQLALQCDSARQLRAERFERTARPPRSEQQTAPLRWPTAPNARNTNGQARFLDTRPDAGG